MSECTLAPPSPRDSVCQIAHVAAVTVRAAIEGLVGTWKYACHRMCCFPPICLFGSLYFLCSCVHVLGMLLGLVSGHHPSLKWGCRQETTSDALPCFQTSLLRCSSYKVCMYSVPLPDAHASARAKFRIFASLLKGSPCCPSSDEHIHGSHCALDFPTLGL